MVGTGVVGVEGSVSSGGAASPSGVVVSGCCGSFCGPEGCGSDSTEPCASSPVSRPWPARWRSARSRLGLPFSALVSSVSVGSLKFAMQSNSSWSVT